MSNIKGPSQIKRALLHSIVHNQELYAVTSWTEVGLTTSRNREKLLPVQKRAALKAARAYHTVSPDTILIIANMLPIDEMAEERKLV